MSCIGFLPFVGLLFAGDGYEPYRETTYITVGGLASECSVAVLHTSLQLPNCCHPLSLQRNEN